jgi:hypothetical protein
MIVSTARRGKVYRKSLPEPRMGDMPFPDQPRRPFAREEIERLPAGARGVYGLFDAEGCVFVGKGNLRERLLGHLKGGFLEEARCIRRHAPTYWLCEETEQFVVRHMGLVVEYQPRCRST